MFNPTSHNSTFSVQSDLDLHCPQKLPVSSTVKKDLNICVILDNDYFRQRLVMLEDQKVKYGSPTQR